jgi:hypothetical protein
MFSGSRSYWRKSWPKPFRRKRRWAPTPWSRNRFYAFFEFFRGKREAAVYCFQRLARAFYRRRFKGFEHTPFCRHNSDRVAKPGGRVHLLLRFGGSRGFTLMGGFPGQYRGPMSEILEALFHRRATKAFDRSKSHKYCVNKSSMQPAMLPPVSICNRTGSFGWNRRRERQPRRHSALDKCLR